MPFGKSKFYKHLTLFEKISYSISWTIGFCVSAFFIFLWVKTLISTKGHVSMVDIFLGLGLSIIPLLLANKIRAKGLSRIPPEERTTSDEQQLKQATEGSKLMAKSVKQFLLTD